MAVQVMGADSGLGVAPNLGEVQALRAEPERLDLGKAVRTGGGQVPAWVAGKETLLGVS